MRRTWQPCSSCNDGIVSYLGMVGVCGECDGTGRIPVLARPSARLPGILVTALIAGVAWFVIGILVGRATATAPTVWVAVPQTAFAPLPVSLMPAPPLLTPSPTPTPTAKPTRKPTPRPTTQAPRPAGAAIRIEVTWYCNLTHPEARRSRCSRGHPDVAGDQLYAAASPDLPWRGKVVRVCAGGCVFVRVIDCDCQATHSLDLYADAFLALAPLGAGRLSATATVQR